MITRFKKSPFLRSEELVPVREAQKNITRFFKKGLVRVTKNGRSLGYLLSDEALADLIEDIEASNPAFIAEMEKEMKSKKRIPLDDVLKEYGIKRE